MIIRRVKLESRYLSNGLCHLQFAFKDLVFTVLLMSLVDGKVYPTSLR